MSHLPGILRILPGNKGNSNVHHPDTKPFYVSVINHLNGKLPDGQMVTPLRITAFDIETGALPQFANGNPFGIEEDKEALSHYTGEILLAGLMDQSLVPEHFLDDEASILTGSFDRMTITHSNGGIIVGQNLSLFDLPWAVVRGSRAHGIDVPPWMTEVTCADAKYRLLQNRVVDTCRLFSSHGKFAKAGTVMKLSLLAKFWGRDDFESEGATFGQEWRRGDADSRQALVKYNTWNLADSLVLALFSGVLDHYRPGALSLLRDNQIIVPRGRSWDGCDYKPDGPGPSFQGAPPTPDSNVAYFGWITAPQSDLLSNGPVGGWKKGTKEATKQSWPFTTGRQNAAGMQIVGFVCAGPDGVEHVWNPGDEMDVIVTALRIIDARTRDCRCYTDCKKLFRALLTFRASLYNVVLEPWVNGFGVKEWLRDLSKVGAAFNEGDSEGLDSISKAAVQSGMLTSYEDIDTLPTYCGQDAAAFRTRVSYYALAARHYIVMDPWTIAVEASKFPMDALPAAA